MAKSREAEVNICYISFEQSDTIERLLSFFFFFFYLFSCIIVFYRASLLTLPRSHFFFPPFCVGFYIIRKCIVMRTTSFDLKLLFLIRFFYSSLSFSLSCSMFCMEQDKSHKLFPSFIVEWTHTYKYIETHTHEESREKKEFSKGRKTQSATTIASEMRMVLVAFLPPASLLLSYYLFYSLSLYCHFNSSVVVIFSARSSNTSRLVDLRN